MVRWEPGAHERLQAAALDLYAERGFDQTTAADIAAAAGLTERTFFRYFTDKREVLFAGQDRFQQLFVDGVATAPDDVSPLDAVAHALRASATFLPGERRAYSRQRYAIISANPGLHERELLKMAALSRAVADALQARGVHEAEATLAADTGMTVFGVAFRRWMEPGEERSLDVVVDDVLGDLRALALSLR